MRWALLALLGAALTGQQPVRAQPSPVRDPFLAGYMRELLRSEPAAAKKLYEQAMAAADLPNFQTELAALRVWEGSWDLEVRRRARSALAGRNFLPRSGMGPTTINGLQDLKTRFQEALADEDTERIHELRAQLKDWVEKRPWFQTPRTLVAPQLPVFRGDPSSAIDHQLEALKRDRQLALDAGDHAEANKIWARILRHQRAKARTVAKHLAARRWTKMTRLHLAGQHKQAIRMEQMLGTGVRFYRRFQRRQDPVRLIQAIRGWDEDRRRERLAEVRSALTRLLASRELLEEERTVLRELGTRLATLLEDGQPEQALVLAARTPYRSELFRQRN